MGKLLVLLIVFYFSHAEAQLPPPSVDLSRDMVVSHVELFNYFWLANFQNFTAAQFSCSSMARKGKKGKALKSKKKTGKKAGGKSGKKTAKKNKKNKKKKPAKKNPTTACPTYDELMNSWAYALFQSPALANAARAIKFQLYASGP